MKVLFHQIRNENFPTYGHRLDYMSDSLFHGFRSLFGADCIDFPKMEHMYKDNFPLVQTDKCKGFSLYNRLDDISVDREDIDTRFLSDEFDYIILSVHHSMNYAKDEIQQYVNHIIENNNHSIICIVDGNDCQNSTFGIPDYCLMFKRELVNPHRNQRPISFSIPKENIVKEIPEKSQDFATIVPGMHGHPHLNTYIFNTEEEYNQDYQKSYFGFTSKKGGWDCLRHYEILANGCLPYFTDLEVRPDWTMVNYPHDLCYRVKQMEGVHPNWLHYAVGSCMDVLNTYGHKIDFDRFIKVRYNELCNEMLEYTRNYLTTEAQAKYVLNTLNE